MTNKGRLQVIYDGLVLFDGSGAESLEFDENMSGDLRLVGKFPPVPVDQPRPRFRIVRDGDES